MAAGQGHTRHASRLSSAAASTADPALRDHATSKITTVSRLGADNSTSRSAGQSEDDPVPVPAAPVSSDVGLDVMSHRSESTRYNLRSNPGPSVRLRDHVV
ncbi:hypothetical protein NDU88_002884 [Pleurodeles waltl]|uniref:Uncharacterized protein n=1 Tax=Pleurodeles waltl TaxID=8319 RepID=A0AAV7M2C6_PLEWA|nr:hypothetical protein NDU88_002884 [Pleurodeles waltl]